MTLLTPSKSYEPFYIYAHYDENEIVYIGKGNGGRAWTTSGRDAPHKHFMEERLNDGKAEFVKILETGLHHNQVVELEELVIKTMQPRYNKFFSEDWKSKNKTRGLKGAEKSSKAVKTPLGVFPSCRAAADAHEIKYATLINRVKSPSKKMEGYQYVSY